MVVFSEYHLLAGWGPRPVDFVSPSHFVDSCHFLIFPVVSECSEMSETFAVRFLFPFLKPFGIVCSVSSVNGDDFDFLTVLGSIFDQKMGKSSV